MTLFHSPLSIIIFSLLHFFNGNCGKLKAIHKIAFTSTIHPERLFLGNFQDQLKGTAIEERRSAVVDEQSCVLFSTTAHLLKRRNSTAAPHNVLKKSAAVDEQICVLFSTAAHLLRSRSRRATAAAAPVRISPQ